MFFFAQATRLQAQLSASANELSASRAQVQSLTDQLQHHQKLSNTEAQGPAPRLGDEREAALTQQLADTVAKSNEHRSKLLAILRKYKAMDAVRQNTATELMGFCDRSIAPSPTDLVRMIAALDAVASSSAMPTPTPSAATGAVDSADDTPRVVQSSARTPIRPVNSHSVRLQCTMPAYLT